ncbi:MAG: hypothetical protein WC880_02920 [Candidatus Paceibacterota bacterium]
MISKIGSSEGAGFPGWKPRDQEGRKSPEKTAATPVTPEQKKPRSSPGKGLGERLDIDV